MSKLYLAILPLLLGTLALSVLCDFNFTALIATIKSIAPLDWHAIGVSIFCGSLIGWERMLRKKELGMRTSIFIILGTYIFTAISVHVTGSQVDPTRIIAQIVSGVGFLGAGVMFTKDNKVSGLTSAATIWFLAALGVCIGIGYLPVAVILATVGVTLLIVINEVDDAIVKKSKNLFSSKPVYRVSVKNNVLMPDTYIVQRKTMFGIWWQVGEDYEEVDGAIRAACRLRADSHNRKAIIG